MASRKEVVTGVGLADVKPSSYSQFSLFHACRNGCTASALLAAVPSYHNYPSAISSLKKKKKNLLF